MVSIFIVSFYSVTRKVSLVFFLAKLLPLFLDLFLRKMELLTKSASARKGGKRGGREGQRKEDKKEREREGGKEGRKKGRKEGGREGREEERRRSVCVPHGLPPLLPISLSNPDSPAHKGPHSQAKLL